MTDFDQLGSFYLGRPHDLANGKTDTEPLLYDSDDLTTHAVCVGMTGSGKTGLCISLLEEAARKQLSPDDFAASQAEKMNRRRPDHGCAAVPGRGYYLVLILSSQLKHLNPEP